MTSAYELDQSDGLLVITLKQKLDLDSVHGLIKHIAENYDYRFRLWDLSSFKDSFKLNELRSYAVLGDQILTQPGAIALYSESDLLYGEMRQYAAIRESSKKVDIKLQVFRDYDQALKWLFNQQQLTSNNR